jgi:gentisate 1,2-dioxygenase
LIFVLKGRGATTIWNDKGVKQTFEWQDGSLFALPLNAWHQHFNGQGDEAARFFSVNSMPIVFNLFHSADFIFDTPRDFADRLRRGRILQRQGQSLSWSGVGH